MVQAEDMSRTEDHEQRIRALEFQTEASLYQMVVFRPRVDVVVGDDAFIFHIPPDLDDAQLLAVSASLFEAGGGTCQVQLRHSDPCETGSDVLTTKITIPAGDCYDDNSAVVADDVIVAEGDQIHVDVDQASGVGMDIAMVFTGADLAAVIVEGSQGPPGGVTQWTGAWQTATGYTTGQAVSNGGTTYVSIVNHTSGAASEPGVGVDWEDFWQLLVERNPNSGFQVAVLGNGYPLDVGVKAAIPIPFDCEIVEATLLADGAGNVVVDLWKDTYGNYPPTDADSITAATPLTLSAANKTTDTALVGWDTSLNVGDVLMVVIESVSNLRWLNIALRVARP